jgi:hypothetical protein
MQPTLVKRRIAIVLLAATALLGTAGAVSAAPKTSGSQTSVSISCIALPAPLPALCLNV